MDLLEEVKNQYLDIESQVNGDCRTFIENWVFNTVERFIVEKEDLQYMVQVFKELPTEWFSQCEGLDSLLTDTIWLLDIKWENNENFAEHRKDLAEFLERLFDEEVVSFSLAVERLDPGILEMSGVINSSSALLKKTVRIKTAQFYKQQKFNLFREESEGYSKVLGEITEQMYAPTSLERSVHRAHRNLLEIIGFFDLDPNRVFDVILDIFMEFVYAEHSFFLDLLKCFQVEPQKLANLLGFKYQHYAGSEEGTPRSLYLISGLLCRRSLIKLEDLYPHLSRGLEENQNSEFEVFSERIKKKASKVGVISLSSKSAPDADKAAEGSGDDQSSLYLNLSKNQVAGLIEGLFAVGDFSNAMRLLKGLPYLVMCYENIGKLLCFYMHVMIEPLYSSIGSAGRQQIINANGENCNPASGVFRHPLLFYSTSRSVNCPTIGSFEELERVLRNLLPFISGNIYHDPALFTKLLRLASFQLDREKNSDSFVSVGTFWIFMMRKLFLPSLPSMSPCNPGVSLALWNLFQNFNYRIRYGIYGEWKNSVYASDAAEEYPLVAYSKAVAANEIRKVMRRVSKENVKTYGRMMAKVVHSNPLICQGIILDQIQVYDNLIVPTVDSFRYFTDFDYDVLSFTLVDALCNPNRSRLKDDGTNISSWLSNLSVFCGYVLKRAPGMELGGILKYIVCQLQDGNVYDLTVLKELIQKMSGIENIEDISDSQLELLTGGETLKNEFSQLLSQVKNCKKPSARLVSALRESGLSIPILIFIGRLRNACAFHTDVPHLKLIGTLFDQCQETLFQFTEFLRVNLQREEIIQMVPSLQVLVMKCGLDPQVAFYICRQKLASNDPVLEAENIRQIRLISQERNWLIMKPEFFFLFWRLDNSDIHVPTERYRVELSKLMQQLVSLSDASSAAHYASIGMTETSSQASKRRKERERMQQVIIKLERELNDLTFHVEQIVMPKLMIEKDSWFNVSNTLASVLVQRCFYPRMLFSPMDAIFCARFIRLMHSIGTPNLNTCLLYKKILTNLHWVLVGLTEKEAYNYGRFLEHVLIQLMEWRFDVSKYSVEVHGRKSNLLPGFSHFSRLPSDPKEITRNQLMTHSEYRGVLKNWLDCMGKAFQGCLLSGEFMQMKNSLIVLTRLKDIFPRDEYVGKLLEDALETILGNGADKEGTEHREDLRVMAIRYQSILLASKGDWVEYLSNGLIKLPTLETEPGKEGENEENKENATEQGEEKKEQATTEGQEESKEQENKVEEWTTKMDTTEDQATEDAINDKKKEEEEEGALANSNSSDLVSPTNLDQMLYASVIDTSSSNDNIRVTAIVNNHIRKRPISPQPPPHQYEKKVEETIDSRGSHQKNNSPPSHSANAATSYYSDSESKRIRTATSDDLVEEDRNTSRSTHNGSERRDERRDYSPPKRHSGSANRSSSLNSNDPQYPSWYGRSADQEVYGMRSERMERERLDRERIDRERIDRERIDRERIDRERVDRERVDRERVDRERVDRERVERERNDRERLDRERVDRERSDRERSERDRIDRERVDRERSDRERVDREKSSSSWNSTSSSSNRNYSQRRDDGGQRRDDGGSQRRDDSGLRRDDGGQRRDDRRSPYYENSGVRSNNSTPLYDEVRRDDRRKVSTSSSYTFDDNQRRSTSGNEYYGRSSDERRSIVMLSSSSSGSQAAASNNGNSNRRITLTSNSNSSGNDGSRQITLYSDREGRDNRGSRGGDSRDRDSRDNNASGSRRGNSASSSNSASRYSGYRD